MVEVVGAAAPVGAVNAMVELGASDLQTTSHKPTRPTRGATTRSTASMVLYPSSGMAWITVSTDGWRTEGGSKDRGFHNRDE